MLLSLVSFVLCLQTTLSGLGPDGGELIICPLVFQLCFLTLANNCKKTRMQETAKVSRKLTYHRNIRLFRS